MDSVNEPEPGRERGRFGFRHLVAVIAATAILTSGVATYAAHTFPDVPDSNPFHDEISWMANTGISTGFGDGTYRPGDPVSRQAMSAFMQRLYNLNVGNGGLSQQTQANFNVTGLGTGGWQNIPGMSNVVVVPDGTQARVLANFSGQSNCHGGSNGTVFLIDSSITVRPRCELRVLINGTPMTGIDSYYFDSSNSGNDGPGSWRSLGVVRYSEVLNPGVYTLVPQVTRFNSVIAIGYTPPTWNLQNSVMTAQVELTAAG